MSHHTKLNTVQFTVIIPTKNRPQLVKRAIESVRIQTYNPVFIIIVDDGSEAHNLSMLTEIVALESDKECQLIRLPSRENGHGPGFVRNTGVFAAKTDYVCFLDDDDEFINNQYLETVAKQLSTQSEMAPDLVLSNQCAVKENGEIVKNNIWLEHYLQKKILSEPLGNDFYILPKHFFDDKVEFAHVNTWIVKKSLFNFAGKFDENIRYEEDRELFFRLTESAERVWAYPYDTAMHYVPVKHSVSSDLAHINKLMYQIQLYTKVLTRPQKKLRSTLIKKQLGYIYKTLTLILVDEKRYVEALFFAKQAASCHVTFKWLAYCFYLRFVTLIK